MPFPEGRNPILLEIFQSPKKRKVITETTGKIEEVSITAFDLLFDH